MPFVVVFAASNGRTVGMLPIEKRTISVMTLYAAVNSLPESVLKAALAAAYARWMQWCVCLNAEEGASLQEFGEALAWIHERESSILQSDDPAHMQRVLCNILESERWLMEYRTGHGCGQCAECHLSKAQKYGFSALSSVEDNKGALTFPVQWAASTNSRWSSARLN